MKAWTLGIIFISLCGKLLENFLPRGEKSPLFSPMRFLLSLCLIVVISSPLWKIHSQKDTSFSISFPWNTESKIDTNTLILEQMGKTMKKSVDTAFPKIEYTLEICADETGLPELVKVIGTSREDGVRIADFIQKNYSLKAVLE